MDTYSKRFPEEVLPPERKIGAVISPQNYFDILHSIWNVKRNLKDKLFKLGRSPHVPIWWDMKYIKIVKRCDLKTSHQKQEKIPENSGFHSA